MNFNEDEKVMKIIVIPVTSTEDYNQLEYVINQYLWSNHGTFSFFLFKGYEY